MVTDNDDTTMSVEEAYERLQRLLAEYDLALLKTDSAYAKRRRIVINPETQTWLFAPLWTHPTSIRNLDSWATRIIMRLKFNVWPCCGGRTQFAPGTWETPHSWRGWKRPGNKRYIKHLPRNRALELYAHAILSFYNGRTRAR